MCLPGPSAGNWQGAGGGKGEDPWGPSSPLVALGRECLGPGQTLYNSAAFKPQSYPYGMRSTYWCMGYFTAGGSGQFVGG